MTIKFTDQQQQAIDARGGSVLVSAAAGSGKTAVLVQRVLNMLTKDGFGVDELLIVTFTRAAAAQMREKIDKEIRARLQKDPNNHALRKQQQLLPLAHICTIDSFCLQLIKEHGAAHGIAQDLRLLDDSERRLVRAQAVEETLEAAYQAGEDAFAQLGLLLEFAGDDSKLARLIQTTADKAAACPHPHAWLDSLAQDRTEDWTKLLITHMREGLDHCRKLAFFDSDIALIDSLLALHNWNDWRAALQNITYERLPRGLPEQDKAQRTKMKKQLEKLAKLFCVSGQEHTQDMQVLLPIANVFVALVRDFIARCDEKKAARQAADFNDVLHWALQLLVDSDRQKTPLAKQLCGQFREILIDEYQDINQAQGLLFDALSQNNQNLFMVGDVKQSIYGFRQASPELFLEKRNCYHQYDGKTYPACVILGKNFRSKAGVTDAVNFTFRQLMRAQAAEIEYTADEELVCGRDDISVCDAELHLLQYEENQTQAEADYIAQWIAGEIAHKGLQPRDFCILLRADKKSGMAYAQALQAVNVSAHAAETESLFQSREIQLFLSLLRVVDNPVQDIPLAAILLSPMVGVSPDDLAKLRMQQPNASLYHCLHIATQNNTQCADFLARLAGWRRMSAVYAVGDFTRMLLEDTGLLALACAMKQPARRRANLYRLSDYARDFSTRNTAGLSGFLRYMERVEAYETLTAANVMNESANVVRIMSIHKSKGLEFPVCILAQCTKKFNMADAKDSLLLHTKTGLGLMRPELENRTRLQTLPHTALSCAIRRGTLAEELRLLYVAMTRARDRLIMLTSHKNTKKAVQNAAAGCVFDSPAYAPAAIQSANSYADWLIPALLRHPCADELRNIAGLDSSVILPASQQLHFVCAQAKALGQTTAQPSTSSPTLDATLLQTVHERLEYRYPFEILNTLAAKRAVSELTEQSTQDMFAFSSRPAFTRAQGIAAAERGSAMHAFLQYVDYTQAGKNLLGEIERLQNSGYLSARDVQALERDKLSRFFEGELAARMLASPQVLREKKFTLVLPSEEFAADVQGEEIIVQGIIDCAFEEDGALVLLDYKTDRVESMAVLVERYREQLRLYRRAMRRCFGMEVAQTLIYSFWLGEWVQID